MNSQKFEIFFNISTPLGTKKCQTTEKLANLKLFLILRNHAFLLLALTWSPYHTFFPIKEERNGLYGSYAHAGIKIVKSQDTQYMYTVTLRRVLATIIVLHILSVCL
jgi:hypothetical protein